MQGEIISSFIYFLLLDQLNINETSIYDHFNPCSLKKDIIEQKTMVRNIWVILRNEY